MFDYNMTPINKLAATVTSQSGCASDNTLSNEQKRENLVSKVNEMQRIIITLPQESPQRKKLGQEMYGLQVEIKSLRPKRQCKDIKVFILDVMREQLSPLQFKRIIHLASRASDEYSTDN